MTQIFKTSNYSKFKTIPSSELSKEELHLFEREIFALKFVDKENFNVGTHYDNIENRKKGIRKIFAYNFFNLNGEDFEIQVWHRPKLDPQRIDN